jgi:hypothetical protein
MRATRSPLPVRPCASRASTTQEASLRELTLLLDHRDDLVAERRRAPQRLR